MIVDVNYRCRAKSLRTNLWVEGYKCGDERILIRETDEVEVVDKSTFCRCTGILSSDDETYIFEKDICKDIRGNLYQIEFINLNWICRPINQNNGKSAVVPLNNYAWNREDNPLTIIGNMFDADQLGDKTYVVFLRVMQPKITANNDIIYVETETVIRKEYSGCSERDVLNRLVDNLRIQNGPPIKIESIKSF